MIEGKSHPMHGAGNAMSISKISAKLSDNDAASRIDNDSSKSRSSSSEAIALNEADALIASRSCATRLALNAALNPGIEGNAGKPSEKSIPNCAANESIAEKFAATLARTVGKPTRSGLIPRLACNRAIAETPAVRLATAARSSEMFAVACATARAVAVSDATRLASRSRSSANKAEICGKLGMCQFSGGTTRPSETLALALRHA